MALVQVDLGSKDFPYNFKELGATTVVPSALSPMQQTPQSLYLDNVFPLSRGYTSVSFTGHIPAIPSLAEPILDAIKITSVDGSLAYLIITATNFWVFDSSSPNWTVRKSFPSSDRRISYANVRGEIFICIPSIYEIVKYDFYTSTFQTVTLKGIEITDVEGISDSGDRLLMYSYGQIYWSSIYDPLDFIPSLATGAGSSSVLAIRSVITCIVSLGQDFIIYTAQNAVAAKYTGDFNFPYIFSEVVGSAGAASLNHIAYNSNSKVHVVWTYSGFQQVSTEKAEYILPELSDGIISGIRFKYSDGVPSLERLPKLEPLVRFCSNRWLCISVKDATKSYYTDCYVLDTLIGRWGKLTVHHTALIEYWPVALAEIFTYDDIPTVFPTYNDFTGNYRESLGVDLSLITPVPGDSFGIVTHTGAIFTAAPSETAMYRGGLTGLTAEVSRAVFGKFKLVRDAGVHLDQIRVNHLNSGAIAAFSHSYTGEINKRHTAWTALPNQGGTWKGNLIGDSVSIEVSGVFKLTAMELGLSNAGGLNLPMVNTELQYKLVRVETADVYTDQIGVIDVPIPVNRTSVPQSG